MNVNKLFSIGRWFSAAFFAVAGASAAGHTIAGTVGLIHQGSHEITYYFLTDGIYAVAMLACAWGILNFRRWAWLLAVLMTAFLVVAGGFGLSVGSFDGQFLKAALTPILWTVVSAAVLVWLFLPSVRIQYSQRKQIA